MRYKALACDYDETLASGGHMSSDVVQALHRVKASGRRLILVTGREMDDLLVICPDLHIFDRVVCENGGVLYRPAQREERLLTERPSEELIATLREAGVTPLTVGRTIISSHEPQQKAFLDAIHDLELELHVIFNKGALMVLPSGVTKASGLQMALHELGLSAHNVVGIGDAENDHAFLGLCELSIAVENAVPHLKKRVDYVTSRSRGEGVVEAIEQLLETDLESFAPSLERHHVFVGRRADGTEWKVPSYGTSLLLAGAPGSGKTTFALAFLERLIEVGYQFCIVDPEGDYHQFEGAVVLGDAHQPPSVDEVMEVLHKSDQNAVVSLLGLSHEERPRYFKALFPRLQELRDQTGRPHWIILDETHHLLPSTADSANVFLPQKLQGTLMITVHPDHVFPALLSAVDVMVAAGPSSEAILRSFAQKLGQELPMIGREPPVLGEFLAWDRRKTEPPFFFFRSVFPLSKVPRHHRKYAEGDLGLRHSFYFRGPTGRLHLRAQNLMVFMQLADGVDEDTWMYHLQRHDFSRWIREIIRDTELADVIEKIEGVDTSPWHSRSEIQFAIQQRYTLPA